MGKGSINENSNVYFKARKRAATCNERLYSREGAAELLGISVSTLADYELGNTKVVPVDKVVLMADLYNAPELITGYCMHECPIHGFLPLATKEKNLQGIALRLLKGFNEEELKVMKNDLIEITADGEISEEELPKLNSIMEKLEILTEAISEMKIVTEKYLKNVNT
ncbi:MAG: helix-turn-helix domain-containing protein [Catonella sp.]